MLDTTTKMALGSQIVSAKEKVAGLKENVEQKLYGNGEAEERLEAAVQKRLSKAWQELDAALVLVLNA